MSAAPKLNKVSYVGRYDASIVFSGGFCLIMVLDFGRFSATRFLNFPRRKRTFCTRWRIFEPLLVTTDSLRPTKHSTAGTVTMNGCFVWRRQARTRRSAKSTASMLLVSAPVTGPQIGMKPERRDLSLDSRFKVPVCLAERIFNLRHRILLLFASLPWYVK